MYSMTGYGKGEYVQDGITLVVEIKTVNNKNFDFNAKMPRSFIAFEDLVRKEVQKNVKRGRIDLFVSFTDTREKETALEVNVEKAMAYYNASKIISEKLGLENDCTVSMIMKSPEVIVDNTLNDFSEFEQIAHNLAEKGEPLTKDALNSAYLKLNKKYYGKSVVSDDEISFEWARIPHFYRAFYVYKYATGIISAIAIAERILNGGEKELQEYLL